MENRCILSTLDNPMLGGLGLGLSFGREQGLAPSAQLFPCCAGQGLAWDPAKSGLRACRLKQRLARLGPILQAYQAAFPQLTRYPMNVSQNLGHQVLQELAGTFKHDHKPAHISFSPTRVAGSLLWSKAFAAVWRFGCDARILRLSEGPKPQELERVTKGGTEPVAIFLDQVDRLWDPAVAEALEHIVQSAYNMQAFLWIEFVHEGGAPAEADESLKGALTRRLAKLKNRHPLDHLSRDCLSRLESMSGLTLPQGRAPHA